MIYELHNRNLMLLQGMKLCLDFCELNEITPPKLQTRRHPHMRRRYSRPRTRGHYSPTRQTIQIYTEVCSVASRGPRGSWTWPGFTADLTPIGVAAHELGHHWHFTRPESQGRWKPLCEIYRAEVAPCERPITKYGETNRSEAIAEAFKVFLTNPALLLAIAPFHYGFFWRRGVRPVVTEHWSEILSRSQRHLDVVEKWLAPCKPGQISGKPG